MTESQMMACAEDDFDVNPFYNSLQNLYSDIFENAQRKCCLICVPQSSAIKEATFDLNFVEHHVLRPSPFFKGQFLTTDKGNSGTVSLSNEFLQTGQGFPEKRRAEVLAEETGYNANSRQFRILLLDQPLIGPVSRQSEVKRDGMDLYSLKISKPECVRLLQCFKECAEVMEAADKKINIFMKNYMVLRGFLDDAASKLRQMHTEIYQDFQTHLRVSVSQDHRLMTNISQTIENFILICVHDKVAPVLLQECEKENQEISTRLRLIHGTPHGILGIRDEISCSLKSAVTEARKLFEGVTPLEKMMCIKSIMDEITMSVNAHLASRHGDRNVDELCLTSDDYIPLLTAVLAEAQPSHLGSEIFYIEHFHWSGNAKNNLEFSFVTFQASVHFIKNLDLVKLRSQIKTPEEDERPVMPPVAMETPDSPPKSKSRRDRRLDRINRMLDKTSRDIQMMKSEIGQSSESVMRPASNGRSAVSQDPILGEFLSSLQGDQMPSCFGKQS